MSKVKNNLNRLIACCVICLCMAFASVLLAVPQAALADQAGTAYSTMAKKSAKTVKHKHAKTKVPTSKYMATRATTISAATFYYTCECGKLYEKTYSYGYAMASGIEEILIKYAAAPEGGIALCGSSYMSYWTTVAEDLATAYGYPQDRIYNFGLGGTTYKTWKADWYVDSVASKAPSVIIFHGVNSLRYSTDGTDNRTDQAAARECFDGLSASINKLRLLLPETKFILVSGVKAPADYSKEFDWDPYCKSWKRIDIYNQMLSGYAQANADVYYVDIEKYVLTTGVDKNGDTTVFYYSNSNKLRDASSLKSAHDTLWWKEANVLYCPYVIEDLRHPNSTAYSKIWTKVVGKKATTLAFEAGFPEDEEEEPAEAPEPEDITPEEEPTDDWQ